jgi:hypothetical protein
MPLFRVIDWAVPSPPFPTVDRRGIFDFLWADRRPKLTPSDLWDHSNRAIEWWAQMLVAETVARIPRAHFTRGKSIKGDLRGVADYPEHSAACPALEKGVGRV